MARKSPWARAAQLSKLLPERERMSPVDTAWLRMDAPGNLMMIVGVQVFEGRCDVARLRKLMQEHLLQYKQFRCRAVLDPSGAWWEEDRSFDLSHHLVRIGLPGAGGKAELQTLVAQLAAQTLDPMRPLWQFHLVENYDGGHVLIIRIHHCIADGIALIGVLLSLATTDPEAEPASSTRRDRKHADGAGPWDDLLRPLTDATVKAIDVSGDFATKALQLFGAVLEDPNLASASATEAARVAKQVSQDAMALALMDSDTETSLKGKPSGAKVVAWTEPFPLPDVKVVGKALGCSVNDVLLSCAAGAIGSYLRERGESPEDAELRAMVPVNLRGPGKPKTLGNKFGLVPLLLPVGIADPIERVMRVRERMNELKGGYTAVLAMAVLGLAGMAPRVVQKQVLDLLARKATAVMTNVPGPQHALYMAGSRLKQLMFWVPQSGDIGVGVSILSYDGGVQFGLVTDKKLCAQPQDIIDRFAPEFEELVHAVLLLPWDDAADATSAERALNATEALAEAAGHVAQRPKETVEAEDAAPAKPAGVRKRKSAFAAARAGI